MMIGEAITISGGFLPKVWLDAVEASLNPGNAGRSMVVTVHADTSGQVHRDESFENDLDVEYRSLNEQYRSAGKTKHVVPIEDNAAMIFPQRLWDAVGRSDREALYSRYARSLPRIKAMSKKNVYGTYFERMMAFASLKKGQSSVVNQVEYVIGLLMRPARMRESALQIAICNPCEDATGQVLRGFPCLQQIGINFCDDDAIALNALYPSQHLFARGYGNYVGLINLGKFLAEQSGHRFAGVRGFVGCPGRNHAKATIREVCGRMQEALVAT